MINYDVLKNNESGEFKVDTNDEIICCDSGEGTGIHVDLMDDISMAISETAPDWKTRCYRICEAVGFDMGEPDWLMPNEQSMFDELKKKHDALEKTMFDVNKIALDAMKAYLRVCSSGGMPKENRDHIINNFEHMLDLDYLKFALAKNYHERIAENGS